MIYTQDVTAWTDPPSEFHLVSAEIQRSTGREVGKATVKGFAEDLQGFVLGMDVEVYVATESSDTPWEDDLESTSQVFGGEAHSAKQDETGLITLEAYEESEQMQNQRVKLEVEEPTYTDQVLVDFMKETYGNVVRSRESATKFTPYVAPRSEFETLAPVSRRPWRFGNANRGIPLIDAIEDLTNALGGNLWVDKEGVVQVTPYPEDTEWDIPFITELNAGEETQAAEEVIFQGSGIASELGQGAAYVNSQKAPESSTSIAKQGEEPPAPDRVLQDDNVTTQEEADKQAFNHAVEQDQSRDFGNVTIIGNSDIELFDHVVVPELEYDIQDGFMRSSVKNNLQQGKYKVDGLTHKISAEDGFLTTLQLSRPIEETYVGCEVASNPGFKQSYLSRYYNTVESQSTSGQDDSSGFLSGLFGG